jgi:hypothetical protein
MLGLYPLYLRQLQPLLHQTLQQSSQPVAQIVVRRHAHQLKEGQRCYAFDNSGLVKVDSIFDPHCLLFLSAVHINAEFEYRGAVQNPRLCSRPRLLPPDADFAEQLS